MNRLEPLCRPLLKLICEYCCSAKSGAPVTADELQWQVHLCLNDIQTKCENDPSLKREFSRIERPLIFFIDYIIREGDFPFQNEWQEMARNYNELSGDEKFFDLLSETMEDPESSDRLKFFFLLMGLGFDGCHASQKNYVEHRMKLCATRFSFKNQLKDSDLHTKTSDFRAVKTKKPKLLFCFMTVSILFTLFAFGYNLYRFTRISREFKTVLRETEDKAMHLYYKNHADPSSDPKNTDDLEKIMENKKK